MTPAPNPAMTALEERNAALESRLARQQGQIDQIARNSQQQNEANQVEAAQSRVTQAVTDAKTSVDLAERELAGAHDDGDGAVIAAAQRKLSEAAAKRERVNAEADQFKRDLQARERRTTGSAPAPGGDLDTTNLNSWKDRHKEWYGIDQDMTRASHEIDSSVRAAGTFKVGSTEYFNAIDRAMKQRFPDRFAGAPASPAARAEQEVTGQRAPRRYTESIQRGMDAFGLDPKAWDAARAKAVAKGLLPDAPVSGRIMS